MISTEGDFDNAKKKTIEERVPFFEFPSPGLKYINNMKSPRIIKSHLPIEFLPDDIENKCKVNKIIKISTDQRLKSIV